MIMDLLERLRSTNVLASISAFSAAWMVMMATRYFSLSAGDISGGIGIGSDDGSWLPTAYSICEPIGVVLGCWLALGLALRQVMLVSIALFMFASLLPVCAPGFPAVILSRALEGLAAGAILPLSILTQLRAFGPARRALAIALYASSTTMGPQAAGLIDAWIVACFGWTAVFWASVVPGIVSLATGCAGFWKDSFRWRPLIDADLAGLLTLATALGLLACGVSQGDRLRWLQSPATLILFAASGLSFVLFFAHEWHGIRHPVVSVSLTRRWNLALGIICTLPLQFATVFSGAIVPNALTDLQGYRPEQIAPALTAALWPQCLSYATCVAILHFRLIDTRAVLVAGLSIVAIGCFYDLPITSDWIVANFNVGQIIQGLGLPLIIVPLLYIFVGEVSSREGAHAASIFNLSRSMSSTIATAWATTSVRLYGQDKYTELLSNTGFYPAGHRTTITGIAARLAHVDPDPIRVHLQALQIVGETARRQASVLAVSSTLADLGWFLFASCVIVVLMAELGNGFPGRKGGTLK
jgi:MFS transporter, DHA2 family, multidrug resistance protein